MTALRAMRPSDFSQWLRLAEQVEPLFGPMREDEAFEAAARDCLAAGDAFGAEADGFLIGIVAIDRRENAVVWLAVDAAKRGNGVGARLLDKALSALDAARPVIVQTFTPDDPNGAAALSLYRKYGFRRWKIGSENPAVVDTIFLRREPA
jgi:ribosomal protein S18 acetylase RimI-like enzyme